MYPVGGSRADNAPSATATMIRLVALLPLAMAATGATVFGVSELSQGRLFVASVAALMSLALVGLIAGLMIHARLLRKVAAQIRRMQRDRARDDALARAVHELPPRKRAALELILAKEAPPGERLH
jgi:hypothetical protein